MRRRSGLTLIDTLIALAILSILAGVVYPVMVDTTGLGSAMTMAAGVAQVRELIEYHAAIRDVPLSEGGYPNLIRPSWFANARLPDDAWTHRPLDIQTVPGPRSTKFPALKTFTLGPDGLAAGPTAWYNSANGSFCALVPELGSLDTTDRLFDYVNVSSLYDRDDDDDDGDDDDGGSGGDDGGTGGDG